jgi:amidase
VADTAIALDVLGGYEVGDANWAPRPLEPYVKSMRRSPGKLRVAVTATNPYDAPVDEEAIHGLRVGAELLAALGHEVVEAAPAWPTPESLQVFISVFGPAIALAIDAAARRAGREPGEDEIEPLSRVLYERSRSTPAVAYLGAVAQMQAIARGLVAFFADYDLLLTPGLAERPLKIGECNGLGDDPMADLERSGRFTPYTALFNVTGQPAISIPVGFGADGLPTNVQLVGRPLNEDRLLQVALQMEAAHPWAHHRPSSPEHIGDAAGADA